MKLSFHKKLNQVGMLSLHVLVPVVIAVVAVGGIGAYVLAKSHAMVPPGESAGKPYITCNVAAATWPVKGGVTKYTITAKNTGGTSAQMYATWSSYAAKGSFVPITSKISIGSVAPGKSISYSKSVTLPKTNKYGATMGVSVNVVSSPAAQVTPLCDQSWGAK